MLERTIYSLGDPGTFDITDKDDPLYYLARIAHEQSVDRYNLNADGFAYRQDEGSDFSSVATAWDTFAGNLESWFASAVASSEEGWTIPAIPTLPTLPSDPMSGIILQIIFRVGVRILADWLRKKLDPDTTAKEVAQTIRKSFLDDDGNPIMRELQHTPIRIILNRVGEYQDVFYSDLDEP